MSVNTEIWCIFAPVALRGLKWKYQISISIYQISIYQISISKYGNVVYTTINHMLTKQYGSIQQVHKYAIKKTIFCQHCTKHKGGNAKTYLHQF